jgi:tetratricopeptide (TPR) repeat protein
MAYFELNATSENDFDQKLITLLLTIHMQKYKLAEIKDLDSYFEFLRQFEKEANTPRPVKITESEPVTPEQLETLKKRNYPEEYIQWAEKYGHYSIRIEAAIINCVTDALEEADGYYSLLPANQYQIFASDGAGNMYAFDQNEPGNPIRFFDHESYVSCESLKELYSEHYDYYETKDGTLVNSNLLDESVIFDSEGNYRDDSKYIREYLKDPEVSKPLATSSFLNFLLSITATGFKLIVFRYAHKIYTISENLIRSGRIEDGIACYSELVATNTNMAMYYNDRAYLYRMSGQLDSALNDVYKAISIHESDGLFYGTLAEILSDMDDDDGFFLNLEIAVKNGMKMELIESSILDKYSTDPRLAALSEKYS